MKYLVICVSIAMISCGGSSREVSETGSEQPESSNGQSCLAGIIDQTKWYPLSAVASLVNQPEESIKQQVNERFSSCQYNWKSDRKHMMKAGNIEMEVPTNNVIGIMIENLDEAIEKASRMHKNRTFTYAEYFDGYHTQISEEDQKIIDETIDRKAEEDKSVETAKSLLAMAKTENYTELDNLGDRANYYIQLAPGLRETRLAILHGNVVLLVNVDISDDDGDDLAAAKTIAEAIMGLCE